MMKRCVVLFLLACGLTSQAFIVDYNPAGYPPHWNLAYPAPGTGKAPSETVSTNCYNPWTHAIRYFLAADAYSSNNGTAELNAVRNSFGQWMSIPGTAIKFEEAGLITPGTNFDINLSWATNFVYWKKGTNTLVDGGLADLQSRLGLTFYLRFSTNDNAFAVAQIVLNGVESSWFTDFNDVNNTNFFVEATATHEIGHLLGLDHTASVAASLFWSGSSGVSTQAGLSDDETAAARFLYPAPTNGLYYGGIAGVVSLNTTNLAAVASQLGTTNVLSTTNLTGALVTAEDAHGNFAGCALTLSNGVYLIPSLAPGKYNVRVTPLGANNDPYAFSSPQDFYGAFSNAFISFQPTTNISVTVSSSATNSLNVLVAPAVQSSVVSYLTTPFNPSSPTGYYIEATRNGVQAPQGLSNYVFELLVPTNSISTNNVLVSIGGDGIDIGPTSVDATEFISYGLYGLSIPITVHSDAAPGVRSVSVTAGGMTYWVNGCFRIRSSVPDFNFDGLDDRFQREYFPVFTSAAAAPGSDPDGDGYNNAAEYLAGSNPTNASSFLNINSVTETTQGALLSWQSQPGKTFQVFSSPTFQPSAWQPVGAPFVSSPDASLQAAASAGLILSNPSGITNLLPTVAFSNLGALLGFAGSPNPGLEVLFFDPSPNAGKKFYRVSAVSPGN